jgi:LEA14-like dessication related protein
MNMRQFFPVLTAGFLIVACANSPVPETQRPPFPVPTLAFNGIQAATPDDLSLSFALAIENPFPTPAFAVFDSWRVEVNGRTADSGFSLDGWDSGFAVSAENTASFPLQLLMDVAALAETGLAPEDNYEVKLITVMRFSGDAEAAASFQAALYDGYSAPFVVSATAAFPGVRAPVFSITDIAIFQAELINTRFRVGLRIDNPNPFPVELSSLSYVLFGNGRFWAEGIERNIIEVPPKSFVQGNVLLLMNFMGMRRELLDQIINLVDVSYRFSGAAKVTTGIDHLPEFTTRFDLYGFSQVVGNEW